MGAPFWVGRNREAEVEYGRARRRRPREIRQMGAEFEDRRARRRRPAEGRRIRSRSRGAEGEQRRGDSRRAASSSPIERWKMDSFLFVEVVLVRSRREAGQGFVNATPLQRYLSSIGIEISNPTRVGLNRLFFLAPTGSLIQADAFSASPNRRTVARRDQSTEARGRKAACCRHSVTSGS
jgi:hypothetical protein